MNSKLKEAAQTIFGLSLLAAIFLLQSKSSNFIEYSGIVFIGILIVTRIVRHHKTKNQNKKEEPGN
jgi:hypothetical protein